MVYYNIKKNNLLLKFLNCLLLTIYVFMCLFGSYVSASFNFEHNDVSYSLPDLPTSDYQYFYIVSGENNFIFLYYTNENIVTKSHYCVYYFYNPSSDTSWSEPYNGNVSGLTSSQISKIIYSSTDLYDNSGNVVFQASSNIKNPEVTTSISDLENLSVNGISISANSWSEQDLYILFYNTSFNNSINNRTEPLQKFLLVPYLAENIPSPFYDPTNSTSTNIKYYIPISNIGFPLNIGNTYEIRFATIESYVDPIDPNNYYNYYNFLGDPYSFTISNNVSQDTINTINQNIATQTEKTYNEELNNSINNQTQSIDNINNSINDPNIDSTFNLPSDNTPDNTQNGINNIFTNIYNSFTRGTARDIVFPIPFTDKNITLKANYISNMLSHNGLSWVINFIRSFWWYFIARFIITDIANKIKKIKSGDIENIQNDNIRSDML